MPTITAGRIRLRCPVCGSVTHPITAALGMPFSIVSAILTWS